MIDKIIFKKEIPNIESYFELFESTGWNTEYKLNKEELYRTLSNSYYFVSAYSENRLVGFGRIQSDGILHAMIYDMIVHPAFQFKGIGTNILNLLIKKCLDENIRDIQLFCAEGKRSFYEKISVCLATRTPSCAIEFWGWKRDLCTGERSRRIGGRSSKRGRIGIRSHRVADDV